MCCTLKCWQCLWVGISQGTQKRVKLKRDILNERGHKSVDNSTEWGVAWLLHLWKCKRLQSYVSENHNFIWVGRDPQRPFHPTPLQRIRTPTVRLGCSELSPPWLWSSPGMGIHHLLGNLFQCFPTFMVKIFFFISSVKISLRALQIPDWNYLLKVLKVYTVLNW